MSGPADAAVGPSARPATCEYAVALCTYNGASFIAEQLDSIAGATPKPSEVVIVDDASSDATVAVLDEERRGQRFERLVVEVQPVNVGSLRSFERALAATTRPIVFLSDQDDVWVEDKPRRMLAAFDRRPDLLLLFSDADIVDATRRPAGYGLFDALELSDAEKSTVRHGDAFDVFIRRNLATGATVAMRRELLDVALPFPDGWVHDEWLATLAAAIGTVDFLDDRLIAYRQHGANQIGARRLSFRDKIETAFRRPGTYYARHIARAAALIDRLEAIEAHGRRLPPDRLSKARAKLAHLRMRADLPAARVGRLVPIARMWLGGGYRRYATGFNSVARDLFHRR